MPLTLVTPPALVPVSLSDAKEHLRVTDDAEDDLITSMVAAATSYFDAENGTLGRAIMEQTWRLTLDSAPTGDLILPFPPVQSVSSVKYYDGENSEQTFSSSNYRVVIEGGVARVQLVSGASWPSVYDRADAFWVTYVTGAASAGDVDEGLVLAIKLLLAHWYEHREGAVVGATTATLPIGVDFLTHRLRAPESLF
jgi:uncharacterized phiE125 gp8 family phage protein